MCVLCRPLDELHDELLIDLVNKPKMQYETVGEELPRIDQEIDPVFMLGRQIREDIVID